MSRDIGALVAGVLASTPIPSALEDLDKGTLAQVLRRATERGITPEDYLAEAIAEAAEEVTVNAEAAEIVAGIRRLRSGLV